MCQTPKEPSKHEPEPHGESAWENDQAERSYYYDDAHGYEEYDPGAEDADESEDEGTEPE